ncbi:MAG: SIS domain-containing protein [Pelolinea sp.]|nr:SIS domain-containing protein [Pelolinea sp.]
MQDILFSEISEQPAIIQRLFDSEADHITKIASELRNRFKYIVIAARGTSDNAARYAQYVLGAFNHYQVALATPSLFTVYKNPPNLKEALVIGVSQSGQSPDIVSVLASAKEQGCSTLCITNDVKSPLAKTSEFVISQHTGHEKAVAATKTYTASLAAFALLSLAFDKNVKREKELHILPEKLAGIISSACEVVKTTERYRYMEHCVVIGRGFNYATAFEIALKVKELTRVVSVPYSSADFSHGPIATVRSGFPVIVVAPSGEMYPHIREFVDKLIGMGAEIISISDKKEITSKSNLGFVIPAGIPEWLSPIACILPGQLFARQLAIEKGLNIDKPEGLTKVTETY